MSVNVKKLVQLALKKADQVAGATEPVVYTKVVPATYDPTTDSNDPAETDYPIDRVVLAELTEAEQRWFTVIDRLSQKAIIAANDLPVVPARNDYITTQNGIRWEIMRIRKPPGLSVWLIYLQGP